MRNLKHRYHTKSRCPHIVQYQKPVSKFHLWKGTYGSIISLAFLMAFIVFCGYGYAQASKNGVQASNYQQQVASVSAQYNTTKADDDQVNAELNAIKQLDPDPSQAQIEAYIKTIFGQDATTAIAISHHECGTWDKDYPKCHLKTDREDSIGLFQINLYNSKQWIHAGRIPGANMVQKEKWLENPYDNTLYAYWVYKTSGFTPWSTFTSGAYLK